MSVNKRLENLLTFLVKNLVFFNCSISSATQITSAWDAGITGVTLSKDYPVIIAMKYNGENAETINLTGGTLLLHYLWVEYHIRVYVYSNVPSGTRITSSAGYMSVIGIE